MSKIKICGLTRKEDILAVNEIKPDYIGFVFAKSKRQISLEQAQELKKQLSFDIPSVGVFVNEKTEKISHIVQRGVIDIIQLHGQETNAEIKMLKKMFHLPIIKAISVKTKYDIQQAEKMEADYILFDNGAGGTGETFDWNLLKNIKKPYFIAGGLQIENIQEALKKCPYGVDVSSGVETEGKKDKQKMKQIVEMVKKKILGFVNLKNKSTEKAFKNTIIKRIQKEKRTPEKWF